MSQFEQHQAMGVKTGKLQWQWLERIEDVPPGAWNALALPLATPFLEWQWLRHLETSGSAIPQAGWLPRHLTVWRQGTLIAAAPLYIKGHSQGEFVFDHQWADLAQRLGIRYYPKLLGMTPFTPAEGYRFLIAPGEDEAELTAAMLTEIDRFAQAIIDLLQNPDKRITMGQAGRAYALEKFNWSRIAAEVVDVLETRF